MKFLIDAQLPRSHSILLSSAGHDSVHTLELPDANATTDAEIVRRSMQEKRVVVTNHLALQPDGHMLAGTRGGVARRAAEAMMNDNQRRRRQCARIGY